MKRIAIGLSLTLSLLTNPGYGQGLDSIQSRFVQSKALMEKLLGKKADDGALANSTRNLSEKNKSAQGGVDSGGGGTLVRTLHTKGLLDLYLYNSESFNSKEPGIVLPNTRSYTDNGFDAFGNSDSSIISKTLAQVEKWKKSSPIVTTLISDALVKLPIYYVKSKLTFKDQMAFIPDDFNFSEGSISLGAYYLKDIGVFVEKDAFNLLSLPNQMGLLVHESLRHRQLSFESGMSNVTVQKLTALILSEPRPGITLDNVDNLEGPLLQKLLRVASLNIRAKEMAESLCKDRPDTCPTLQGDDEKILKFYREISAYQTTEEFFDKPKEQQEQELTFRRKLRMLVNILRTQKFEVNPDTALLQDLTFSLRNSMDMFRLAKVAKIYNEKNGHSPEEAKAIQDFIRGLKLMGVLAD